MNYILFYRNMPSYNKCPLAIVILHRIRACNRIEKSFLFRDSDHLEMVGPGWSIGDDLRIEKH